jgi:hypothetical protein
MVNYGVHALDGSFEREWRAGEHLGDLELEISRVFERQANGVLFQIDPNSPHDAINVRPPSETFFGMRVDVKIHVAGTVAFDDGSPILETLQELKHNVRNTLIRFQPEF